MAEFRGTFDEVNHLYYDEKGVWVPSCTQLITAAGFSVDLEKVAPRDALDRKSKIGTEVHWLSDIWDIHNDVDTGWLTADNSGYLKSWQELRKMEGFKVIACSEKMIATINGMQCAGEIDKKILWPDGTPGVLDLKCSDDNPPGWRVQTAGYDIMDTGNPNLDTRRYRAVARLYDDGRPGKLLQHTRITDGYAFMNALWAATWRRENGLFSIQDVI